MRLGQERLAARRRAVKLAQENPKLAAEVGVGRPDLSGSDGGWVIDINHAPADAIATLPDLDESLAQQIAGARESA
jgi:DNA uptake protein ComE-like DNA-binding protein